MSNRSYYTHYVTIMSDYVTIMSIMSITHSGQLCLIISLPGNEPLLQLCQYYYVNYVLWDLLLQLLKLCHNYVSYVYWKLLFQWFVLTTIMSIILFCICYVNYDNYVKLCHIIANMCIPNYYFNYFVLFLLCQLWQLCQIMHIIALICISNYYFNYLFWFLLFQFIVLCYIMSIMSIIFIGHNTYKWHNCNNIPLFFSALQSGIWCQKLVLFPLMHS